MTLSADDWSLDKLERELGDRLEIDAQTNARITFLDSFDWRLFEAGCRLTRERQGARTCLLWSTPDRTTPYVLPVEREFRFAEDLPDGFLRSELMKSAGVRALLPIGSARAKRQNARVLDEGGNTVARVVIEESTPLDASNRDAHDPIRTVTVQPLAPDRESFEEVIRRLRNSSAGKGPTADLLRAATQARGRLPGDYVSKPSVSIKPRRRSDEVLKEVLRDLRGTVASNVDGVLADIDTEFLHDLRVACRRARAVLSQMKNILPHSRASHLQKELRWLGQVTNDCRDLDVYLLDMSSYRRQLGDSADVLGDLERLVRRDRSRALRRVRSALRSKRFAQLMATWGDLVDAGPSKADAPRAARPISEVAGRKILKAYRRMVERGARLPDPPPAHDLHKLRIDGKKLRYLLEFFGGLWPAKKVKRLVKELKKFQDILGGFNDMTVQRRHLETSAERLMADGSPKAETVFAMGRLADAMAQRQQEYTARFTERFERFADDESGSLYRDLFGGE